MNRLDVLFYNKAGGPLKLRVAKKVPLPKRYYLWACIALGIITMLPLFHYMSRWQEVNEVPEENQIFLSHLDLEEGLVYSGNVIKSVLDSKTYTSMVLNNGLRVLAVSDPLTSLAGASCDVGVGSFSDPPSIPGLAHLLEHGVFLGDSQHPQSNTFEQFLAEHNGHSNAFTSQENTNYYYKVSADELEESLDRFSSLLSSPLLELESLRREYHAIQSEFLKDKLESARQVWRLIKQLANPDHPFHRLSPGNLETLQNLKDSSVIKDFHSKYYYPENIKCVVYGREDPQDLLEMSRKYFSKITNKRSHSEFDQQISSSTYTAYPPDLLGNWVKYRPLREGNDLDIIWPVTGASRCGLGSSARILSEQHPKSALALLKKQGLATSLSWSIVISTSSFSLLRVNVKLTEIGGKEILTVAKIIFSQILMLRTESISAFKSWQFSMHQESLQSFINHENQEVHHFVKSLSSRISRVLHPAYYLGAPVQAPTITCLNQGLHALTPNNSIVLFGSSYQDQNIYTNTEPWYGIPYTTSKLSDSDLLDLQNNFNKFDLGPPPAPRAKISKTFPLYGRDLDQEPWPTKIYEDKGLTVWWQQDSTFHIPKVDIVLWVYGRHEHSTPRDIALHYMLVEMVRDQLQDMIQPLGYSLGIYYQSSSGFIVTLSGYSDHEQITRSIKDLVSVLMRLDVRQSNRFTYVVKYRAHRELARSDYAEAYKHPLYKSRVLLEKNVAPLDQILSELNQITLDSFRTFYKEFWVDVGCRGLVYGNALKYMAKQYSYILKFLVQKTDNWIKQIDPPFHPTLQYEQGTYYTITPYPNPRETASVADITIILGPTPWNSDIVGSGEELFLRTIMGRVTANMLAEPAFVELRTRQQLGYSVFTKYISHFGIDYIHMCVQGSEHPAVKIANSVLEFLQSYRTTLTYFLESSEDAWTHWTSLVNSVRRDILVKPSTQRMMANNQAIELFSPDPEPDRPDMLVAALEKLTPQKLVQFYDDYILGSKSRRIVSMAQNMNRQWDLSQLDRKFKYLDYENKTEHSSPFLYWHFTYLGLEMGK